MSRSRIREDKRCLNCGHFVAERFCPICGQENIETNHRFHYLFVHFWEEFVHYDSKFWKTIKYLLFSPAKLTKDYLAGKRKSQVNPVQLFIFTSFIVFFVPAILPDFGDKQKKPFVEINSGPKDAENKGEFEDALFGEGGISIFGLKNVNSIEELDSIQQALPKEEKLSFLKYTSYKKILVLNKSKNLGEQLSEAFIHYFPKAIFLYIPIFAFWLWLFHSKKKWLYFDHGIYTLHFFSFIMLLILLYIIADWVLSIFKVEIPGFISFIVFLYFVYYFFHSHRLMYKESKAVSRLLCTILFFINMICMSVFLVLYTLVVAWISISV